MRASAGQRGRAGGFGRSHASGDAACHAPIEQAAADVPACRLLSPLLSPLHYPLEPNSNFQGFAKEIFTDAGKYAIHFGFAPRAAADIAQRTLEARTGRPLETAVTPLAVARTDVAVIPSVTGNQLVRARGLLLRGWLGGEFWAAQERG